jgi:predicted nucleic acid-binding Zn finger protein
MRIKSKNGIFFLSSSRKNTVKRHIHYSALMKRWVCDCEDFAFRRMKEGGNCMHIIACLSFIDTASMEQLEEALI